MNEKESGEAVNRNRERLRRDEGSHILDAFHYTHAGYSERYAECQKDSHMEDDYKGRESGKNIWVEAPKSADTIYQSVFYHPYLYKPKTNIFIGNEKETRKALKSLADLRIRFKESVEREKANRINASLTVPVIDETPAPLPVAPIEMVRQLNSLFDIDPTPRMGWNGDKK